VVLTCLVLELFKSDLAFCWCFSDVFSKCKVIETHLCNSIAPFVINGRLKPLLARNNHGNDRHIVNVSAMEGQFYRVFKTSSHPQTNMAKVVTVLFCFDRNFDMCAKGEFEYDDENFC
jgi:hypothetical protein